LSSLKSGGRQAGLLCSVLADLQYSELYMFVGLSFVVALKDHNLVILRADSLLTGHLKHKTNKFVGVQKQMGGHLVPYHATTCVYLSHCV